MHSNLLYSRFCTFTLQLVLYRFCYNRKQSFIIRQAITTVHIRFYLFFQKFWNINHSNRLLCFWCCNNIPTFRSVISFRNTNLIIFKVNIAFCEGKHFSLSTASPKEYFKNHKISALLVYTSYKTVILRFRPKIQLIRICLTHFLNLFAGIVTKIVNITRVSKQCGYLILHHS